MIAIMKCILVHEFLSFEMHNVFVYGTLMSKELIKKLTGKSFKTRPAILADYKRYSIKDADYPAISQKKGFTTKGLLLENVDEQSISLLSEYEGDEYKKQEVFVLSDQKKVKALVYIWDANPDLLEDKEWDFELFQNGYF